MNELKIRQLAEAFLTVVPDFPMGAEEMQARIKEHGLADFIRGAGGDAAELAEAAGLFSRLDKGGGHEAG